MGRFGYDSKPYPAPNVFVSKARFSFDMVGSGGTRRPRREPVKRIARYRKAADIEQQRKENSLNARHVNRFLRVVQDK